MKNNVSFDAFEVARVFTLSNDTLKAAVEAFHTDTSAPMLKIVLCLLNIVENLIKPFYILPNH